MFLKQKVGKIVETILKKGKENLLKRTVKLIKLLICFQATVTHLHKQTNEGNPTIPSSHYIVNYERSCKCLFL